MDPMIQTLRAVRTRLGVQQWLSLLSMGFTVSLSICCVWLVATRLFSVWVSTPWPCLGMIGLGILATTLWAYRKRPALLDAALEADRRLELQERLTSSLQLADVEAPMVEALHRDAREKLARLNVPNAFPFLLPRSTRWLAIPLLLFGIGYLFLPEFDLLGFRERQVQAKAKEEAQRVLAERLKSVARPLTEPPSAAAVEGATEAASEIERMAEQLSAGQLSEKQALAKMSNLTEDLEKRREALQQASAMPKLANGLGQLAATQSMAQSMLNGNFGEAAQKARELQKKLKEGNLSDDEKKKLGEELKKTAEMLKGKDGEQSSALSDALSKAAAELQMSNLSAEAMQDSANAMSDAELSLEDVASILEQMDKLNLAMADLLKCQQQMLGPSEFCRICGAKLKPCTGGKNCKGCGAGQCCSGICANCGNGWSACKGTGRWRMGFSTKYSNGMGGPGRGRGNSTGPLPDVADAFTPTMLPGEVTKGKFLADIVQRTSPDQHAEPTTEFVSGIVAEAKQEAEQALTKEEIPPAAREFVRQYFSTFDAQQQTEGGNKTAAGKGP